MAERNKYLARIFGERALQIETIQIGPVLIGSCRLKRKVNPMEGVLHGERGLSLAVTDVHTSGHFLAPGPMTLPAYRMVEMGGVLGDGERVVSLSRWNFLKVVTPGDKIEGMRTGRSITISRNKQPVAEGLIEFGRQGLEPHKFGMLLEVAAQTIVANVFNDRPNTEEVLYPLISGVDRIQVLTPAVEDRLCASPTTIRVLKGRDFSGGVVIANNLCRSVALVEGVSFLFATAREVEWLNSYKRSSETSK